MKLSIHLALALVFALTAFGQAKNELPKLSAEEIVAKHLASLGSPDAIHAARNRVLVGQGAIRMGRGGAGSAGGPAQIASEGHKFLLAMVINSVNYPYEKVGFDGKELTFGRPDGRRTPLAEFLRTNSGIVKDGLFGGVFSTSWPLIPSSEGKKIKFRAGMEEAGGKEYYTLEFNPSASDARATLFFDPNSFQHLMSRYRVTIPPPLNSDATQNSNQKPTYVVLTERFSNFAKAGELVMPLNYTIDYSATASEHGASTQWTVQVKEVYYNEKLDEAIFKVS
jgi:hypothetical protein